MRLQLPSLEKKKLKVIGRKAVTTGVQMRECISTVIITEAWGTTTPIKYVKERRETNYCNNILRIEYTSPLIIFSFKPKCETTAAQPLMKSILVRHVLGTTRLICKLLTHVFFFKPNMAFPFPLCLTIDKSNVRI